VVENMPGFYFVGLFFQYAASSAVIFGMVRDAEYIVKQIAARHGAAQAKHSILEREWE
jgi:putative flavoprotein involved in K+ transport